MLTTDLPSYNIECHPSNLPTAVQLLPGREGSGSQRQKQAWGWRTFGATVGTSELVPNRVWLSGWPVALVGELAVVGIYIEASTTCRWFIVTSAPKV